MIAESCRYVTERRGASNCSNVAPTDFAAGRSNKEIPILAMMQNVTEDHTKHQNKDKHQRIPKHSTLSDNLRRMRSPNKNYG